MTKYQMLGYIREEPEAVARTLDAVEARLGDLVDLVAARHPKRLVVAGFGSSYTAAKMSLPLFRRHLAIPSILTVASEIGVDRGVLLDAHTLVILVSRSGERGWLTAACEAAQASGAMCVAVTAAEKSQLARASDLVILTGEGPEAAYPKTKSVMATAAGLMKIALSLDPERSAESEQQNQALSDAVDQLERSIAEGERIVEPLAAWLASHKVALIAGTGGNEGVAQEAALKVQEAAGFYGQWENSGDAIHGALGMLDQSCLFVGLVGRADYKLHLALLDLVGRFGADRLCVAEAGLSLDQACDAVVEIPAAADPLVAPLLFLPPLQLLTYYAAVARGLNPDHPAFAETMLAAMLPPGRAEPDWLTATA